jgi:uncharacterized protein YkwD
MNTLNRFLSLILRRCLVLGNASVVRELPLAILIAVFAETSFSQTISVRDGNRIVRSTGQSRVSQDSTSTKNDISKMERRVFVLVNRERTKRGLKSLSWNEDVAKAARTHSRNMAAYNFFSHNGRDKKTVVDRARLAGINNWRRIGENLVFTSGYDNPIEFAVEKWMTSSTHRKNILDARWDEAAIGVSEAKDGAFYFTQVFLER